VFVNRKYNLGVIVDLHAAPGSQNPWEHSSSRDGTQAWGTSDANIAQTVQVIEFLASRSARSINESNYLTAMESIYMLTLAFTWMIG
jgi:aryl-phospho-beta-D-glucosidase BglC (GH1 family)